MKKRYLLLVLSIVAVSVAAIGATMAAKSDEGVSVTTTISEKTVGIRANKASIDSVVAMPGGEAIVKYNVTNDGGSSNGTASDKGSYDVYAKVNVYFDWTQDDNSKEKFGEIDLSKDYLTMYLNIGTDDEPNYVAIPKNENNDNIYIGSYQQQIKVGDWIVSYYSNDQITLYYTKPLAQNQLSSDYISKIAFDKAMDNKYVDSKLNVTAEVNAVQADSAQAAFATEWGVYPSFVENGNGALVIDTVSENAN